MLQEPEIERPEHQDDPDVGHQPLPEVVPEEQDVHANHDDYHREHVEHGGCLPSHDSFLLWATNRSKITSAHAAFRAVVTKDPWRPGIRNGIVLRSRAEAASTWPKHGF